MRVHVVGEVRDALIAPPGSVPHLRLRNIARAYAAEEIVVEALWGVNLDVGCGEVVAIVGPSGP